MTIHSVTVGAFQENCYLVIDDATRRAALVDPGAEPETILAMVDEAGVVPEAIWLTHAHVDHIGGIAGVARRFDIPIHLHPLDRVLYERGAIQAAMFGIDFEPPPAPTHDLRDGAGLALGDTEWRVMHTPGHAPGHVVFVGARDVLGGDLLFAGSIGRTDLMFADPRAMDASLEQVMTLADDLVVHPGHGPRTTVGRERTSNPFLTGAARLIGRR